MISTQEIRDKEIINILDGKSLGYVSDIEINLERGRIEALIVPSQRGLFGMFSGADEYIIRWKDIKKIGEDVILAEVREATAFEDIHAGRSDRYKDYKGRSKYFDDELDLEDEEREKRNGKPEPSTYSESASYPESPAYRPESPTYRPEPRNDNRESEETSTHSSWKRQEKEGFFRGRVKNSAARDDLSEIRIRLKEEDGANLDDY